MLGTALDPTTLIRRNRTITGISATLLPFNADGSIDWESFAAHLARTAETGLIPAVNMDTGYVHLLDETTRRDALDHARQALGDRPFVAGAFVADQPGARFNFAGYLRQVDQIQRAGGIPVLFQSFGLTGQRGAEIVGWYAAIGKECPQFIAFELGKMFAPFGQIYDLDTYAGLLDIPQCIGAKHSSLSRELEWERLRLRDARRPEFRVFTGNDLAIDMVMYGSDYLLGLSTFAPDLFARRDALWAAGDAAFYALNDLLQYLGFFAFRAPVPAYKHSAAQFLRLRGWIKTDETHPKSPRRPTSDLEVLRDIAERLVPMGS